jgi:hypothetical protein
MKVLKKRNESELEKNYCRKEEKEGVRHLQRSVDQRHLRSRNYSIEPYS